MTKTDHELREFTIQLEPRFKLRSYLRHLDRLIDVGGAYTKRGRLQGESFVSAPRLDPSLPALFGRHENRDARRGPDIRGIGRGLPLGGEHER